MLVDRCTLALDIEQDTAPSRVASPAWTTQSGADRHERWAQHAALDVQIGRLFMRLTNLSSRSKCGGMMRCRDS